MVFLPLSKQRPFFIRIKDNQLVQWGRGKRPLKEFFHQLDVGEGRFLYHMIAQYNLVIVAKRLKDEYVVICSNNQNRIRPVILGKALFGFFPLRVGSKFTTQDAFYQETSNKQFIKCI